MTKKINWKALIICVAISVGTGILSAIVSGSFSDKYASFNKPPLSPPAILFPIVWTVLFILMGISSYLIWESANSEKSSALIVYALQLAVNFVWPIIFFRFEAFRFAFVWILFLLALIVLMIYNFAKINKTAAYLQIPYLVWVAFASYLNLGVYLLNK